MGAAAASAASGEPENESCWPRNAFPPLSFSISCTCASTTTAPDATAERVHAVRGAERAAI